MVENYCSPATCCYKVVNLITALHRLASISLASRKAGPAWWSVLGGVLLLDCCGWRLGCDFKHYFCFHPEPWGVFMIQIDEHVFQMGWNHQLLVEDVHFYMTTWVVEHIFTSIEFWDMIKNSCENRLVRNKFGKGLCSCNGVFQIQPPSSYNKDLPWPR